MFNEILMLNHCNHFSFKLLVASSPQIATFSIGGVVGYPNVILEQLRANDSTIQMDLDASTWVGEFSLEFSLSQNIQYTLV